jgi:hypothetical protein
MPSLGAWAMMGYKPSLDRYGIDISASSVFTSGRWASALLSAATTLAEVSLATPASVLSCTVHLLSNVCQRDTSILSRTAVS